MRFIVHMCTWNDIFIWPLLLMCLVVNNQLCSTYHARIQKNFRGLGCVLDVDAYMYVILFVGRGVFYGNFTIGFNEFEFAGGGVLTPSRSAHANRKIEHNHACSYNIHHVHNRQQ